MLKKLLLGSALAGAALLLCGWLALRWYQAGSLELDFFDDAIAAFEAADRADPPAPGGIVFVGSSSIRLWDTLARDMAPLPVVRRGFGGAHMDHLVHHVDRIVIPYQPRVVVVFAGGNDLGAGTGKTADSYLAKFAELLARLHADLPEARVLFLSLKPTILRWERWPEVRKANDAVARLAEADPLLEYVDVATPMLTADGEPRGELFVWDGLHLSESGYALWTEILRPRLAAAYQGAGGVVSPALAPGGEAAGD